jgi:hypothetical protein
MAISHKNGVALTGLSAVNGVTSISALNGVSATLGSAAPAYVAEVGTRFSATSSSSTSVLTVSATVPVGRRVVVVVNTASGSQTADSMTDSKGNTYTKVSDSISGDDIRRVIFSAPVTTELVSSDTITVTWGSAHFSYRGMAAFALANAATLDTENNTYQSFTDSPSSPDTTTAAATVAIGVLRTAQTRTYTTAWQAIGAAHDFGEGNRAYYFFEEFASAGSKNPAGSLSGFGIAAISWVAYSA